MYYWCDICHWGETLNTVSIPSDERFMTVLFVVSPLTVIICSCLLGYSIQCLEIPVLVSSSWSVFDLAYILYLMETLICKSSYFSGNHYGSLSFIIYY